MNAVSVDVDRMVADLRVAGPPDRPVRHQAITLVRAIGRAKRGQARLVRWSDVRGELQELPQAHGSRPLTRILGCRLALRQANPVTVFQWTCTACSGAYG